MAKAARAGTESGSTTLVNIWKCVAPSMLAVSKRSPGSWLMKL